MIEIGYMYKKVSSNVDIPNSAVKDAYSVSGCESEDFDDWINYWRNNGYWFFDSPSIIEEIAKEQNIDLGDMQLFYYKAYELEWNDDRRRWEEYYPEKSFQTNIQPPQQSTLEGYDIVGFSARNDAECSPLSCNDMASSIEVNKHCLLTSFTQAKTILETGLFSDCEPGPYRIFEVRSINTCSEES